MGKTGKLGELVADLIVMIQIEATDGLIHAHNKVEQHLFELFVSKGYNTAEARKLAIHVVEAIEED